MVLTLAMNWCGSLQSSQRKTSPPPPPTFSTTPRGAGTASTTLIDRIPLAVMGPAQELSSSSAGAARIDMFIRSASDV